MAGEEAVEGNNKRKFSSSASLLPRTSVSLPKTSTALLPREDKQRRNSCPRQPIWVEIETLDKDDETTF